MAATAPTSTPPPSQPGPVPSRKQRVLACELCQKRKIGCDRKFPCANCIKVRAMRKIIDDDESEENTPESMTPDGNAELVLGPDRPGVDLADLWPEITHIQPLWQTYLDRVNPLTKIIHVPSMQPYFVAATSGGRDTIPRNVEALMFSIFLMATVSMSPTECTGLLGSSRQEAIHRFSEGVRLSLIRTSFLKSHDMASLQALLLYFSLQGRYDRHAAWILTGVLVRIAQKMGLHRDGEALGLPPFECEMRRRVWWQIFLVDAKYATASGLGPSNLPINCDTKTPANLDDADMDPSATQPFKAKDGPTEMIFCLLMYRFAKFVKEMPGFEGIIMIPDDESGPGPRTAPTEEQLAAYRRGLARLHGELLEIFEKYLDVNAGPVHAMANAMKDHILQKLEELKTPVKLQKDWGGEVKSTVDNTFRHAVQMLEHNEFNYRVTEGLGFAWFSLLHFQLDILMFVVGQLRRRTEGRLVDSAWRQVEVVYSHHPGLFDMTNKNYTALGVHVLQAWKQREQVIFGRTGRAPEVPLCVTKLRTCLPDSVCKQEPGEQRTPPDPFVPEIAAAYPLDTSPPTLEDLMAFPDPQSFDWDMFTGLLANQEEATLGIGPFGIAPPPTW
ncbi:hypothetical protein MYCTH_2058263 [Thermothelomyces thermophilus ATCC 42464]|uniref:Zn(2)-C6 fungal-type domain-containing protein n=1 Tax=Thermothelomyces thermophilus (strain ATCC 42464 / BCRC 31852 / DSM 1799) TaxID=573729 RepID=G2Q9U7_THET4|nr:uncharacterized protein MYCTH_2058263 [Thermothelomyces thermophilus ATCC 42464]AEO56556.1 hypothetical protein MYCTH_2058263 [Thermothelomyces thermophilus ATCC 42464]